MMPRARRLLPLLALLVLGACGPKVLHVDDHDRPARAPEQVQLLLDAPDRPYRTIALIRSREEDLFRNMEALKREVRAAAARVGADAVILSLSSQSGMESVATTDAEGNLAVGVGSTDDLRVFGRAIIFTGDAPATDGGAEPPRAD